MTTPFPFVAGQVLTAAQLNDIQNLPISDKTASYTLVVADVYKRTIMNSASATTITVNNSIFTVGDVIQIANKGAGVCTVTAGAGVTINTSSTLALAQYGGGYLLALSASTFTFFNLGGAATIDIDYLVVAGGGSGGTFSTPQGYAVGLIGNNTIFSSVVSVGGGAGGAWSNLNGGNGGSGGGGGPYTGTGGTGTANQGYAGGTSSGSGANYGGAGGGGTGAVGANTNGTVGGNGGAGTASSITGSSVTYGGGGGGSRNTGTAGTGGAGGGGAGGAGASGTAGAANTGGGGGAGDSGGGAGAGGGGAGGMRCTVTATGGGGVLETPIKTLKNVNSLVQIGAGGAQVGTGSGFGAAGGSGVVILRYSDTLTITIGAGLTGTESAASGGYKRATITAGSGLVSWA